MSEEFNPNVRGYLLGRGIENNNRQDSRQATEPVEKTVPDPRTTAETQPTPVITPGLYNDEIVDAAPKKIIPSTPTLKPLSPFAKYLKYRMDGKIPEREARPEERQRGKVTDWTEYRNVLKPRAMLSLEKVAHLFPNDDDARAAREFITRPDTMRQTNSIIERGKAVVTPAYQEFQQARETKDPQKIHDAYQKLCSAIADLYILCSPVPNPDEHKFLLEAEQRRSVTSVVRITGNLPGEKPSQMIWSPSEAVQVGIPNNQKDEFSTWLAINPNASPVGFPGLLKPAPHEIYRSRRHLHLDTPHESLTAAEKRDLLTIHGPNGVIIHTIAASELYLRNAKLIQRKARAAKNPTELQKSFSDESFDPYEGAISLWFHDIGRLITHHPVLHILFSEVITEAIGIQPEDRQDYDLSTEMMFQTGKPLVDPASAEAVIDFVKDPVKMVWYICDFFSKFKVDEKITPEQFTELRKSTNTLVDLVAKTHRIRYLGDEMDLVKGLNLFESQKLKQAQYLNEAKLVQTLFGVIFDTEQGLGIPKPEFRAVFRSIEAVKLAFLRHTQDYYMRNAQWDPKSTWQATS